MSIKLENAAAPLLCALSLAPAAAAQLGETPEAGDRVGSALVRGDFNADGLADLAIGAPGESVVKFFFPPPGTTHVKAGIVHLAFGSPAGLENGPKKILKQLPGTATQPGIGSGNAYGTALARGDFDANGFDDLAVGIPGQKVNGFSGAGAVQLLFGSPEGGLNLHVPVLLHQDYYGVLDAAEASDGFGSSLCAGDFNGDGFDDIAAGVPDERVGSVVNAGAVNVIHGSGDGMLKPKNSFWTQGAALQNPVEAYDFFGQALAAGDLNGDGFDDLAVGVPEEDLSFSADGVVHAIYGSGAGLQAAGNQLWHQDSPGIVGEAENDDGYGSALVSADFDLDGIGDLGIGAPGDSIAGVRAGSVTTLFGTTAGLSAVDNLQLSQLDFTPFLEIPEEGDRFGACLTSNTDLGASQVVIGVPGESVDGKPFAGAVEALGLGPSRTVSSGMLFTWAFSPPQTDDGVGSALAVGDFNGNGHTDFAVGVPGKDVGAADAGEVLIALVAAAPFIEVLRQGN